MLEKTLVEERMAFNMRKDMVAQKLPRKTSDNVDAFFDREKKEHVPPAQSESTQQSQHEEQTFQHPYERSVYMREHPEEVLVQWQGPEYELYEKSATWYSVMGLILVAIVAYALFTNSPVMAIVFVLIGVVGYLYVGTPPRVMDFGIIYDGIMVGNRLYHFDEIDSFWIFYDPPHTRVISLHMTGRFTPYVHIPLHQLDPVEVREVLLEFTPEKRQEHNVIDTVERILHI